jgi:hypothetical protein
MNIAEARKTALDLWVRDYREYLEQYLKLSVHKFIEDGITEEQFRSILADSKFTIYCSLIATDFIVRLEQVIMQAKETKKKQETIPEDILKWWLMEYVPDGPLKYEIYSRNINLFSKKYKFIMPGGCVPETMQGAIKLACNRNYPVIDHIKEVKEALQYIKPIPERVSEVENSGSLVGYQHISIFERSLSAGGSYHMWVKGECIVNRCRYNRVEIIFKGTVEDGVKFVYDNHPYQLTESEEKLLSNEED